MDAAMAAVTVMEDCPLFNAGKGAVFNVAGKIEPEASLMPSKPPATHPTVPPIRRGSSAILLTRTKNPSHLVRALYLAPDLAPHPMLSGEAVETLGAVDTVDPSYFWTEARWREHRTGLGLPVEPIEPPSSTRSDAKSDETTKVGSVGDITKDDAPMDLMPKGTIGAVALDVRGCIAAVTSTGGRNNKHIGRVGDTPIMGSGFWAEEWKHQGGALKRTWDRWTGKPTQCGVGVSSTGDGDYYIRRNAASTIARRMQYLDEPLEKAAQYMIDVLFKDGGIGGIIAMENVALPLNCDGMYRGVIRPDGVPYTAILFDEELSEL